MPSIATEPLVPLPLSPKEVARALIEERFEHLPPALLRRKRLAAYGYLKVPAYKGVLRDDFLEATHAHQRIKAQLLPLMQAWAAAGVRVLLFKGFHLAEFIYDLPAKRLYGDTDILIPEADLEGAAEVAVGLGWQVLRRREASFKPEQHVALHLTSPDGNILIEVHIYAVHNVHSPLLTRHLRITEAVWGAAQERPWEGTTVYTMQPTDALLVGLVLNRCWSADDWRLKNADYYDFRALVTQAGVTEEALFARAQELACERTLERYLRRCNAFEGRLELTPPSRLERLRLTLGAFPERLPGIRFLRRLGRVPRALRVTLREFPGVLTARRLLRQHQDMHALFQAAEVEALEQHPFTSKAVLGAIAGIRWSLFLLRPFGEQDIGFCLWRSLALYRALKRLGLEPSLVSGVRKEEGTIRGHAWIEVHNRPLKAFGDTLAPEYYRETFRYPPKTAVTKDSLET